jgi:retron-type reverse transcriptase
VESLVNRLKRDSYNPKPSRRVRIPKPGKQGKTRPLGISCYEDKLVESAVSKLLTAVKAQGNYNDQESQIYR